MQRNVRKMDQTLCFNCFRPLAENVHFCPHCGFPAAQDRETYPLALTWGTVLGGRYIVGRVLGQGGFGITYIALDHRTETRVAIKEYFPEMLASRSTNQNVIPFSGQRSEDFSYGKSAFLEEARMLSQFRDVPNIVHVYSYFEELGTAYFAMEYIEGKSLQSYMESRGGRLDWAETKRLLLPVMDALAQVNAKGIVHRDIKPENIFIDDAGEIKVLDFGAARFSMGERSRSLDVILTHGFAPVEQYSRHGRQGAFTDVYALAATICYIVTGMVPPDSVARMGEDTLPMPSALGVRISPDEEDVLLKALSVDSRDRWQTMPEFKAALLAAEKAAAQTVPIQMPEPLPEAAESVLPPQNPPARERVVPVTAAEKPQETGLPQTAPAPAAPEKAEKPEKKPHGKRALWVGIAAAILVAGLVLVFTLPRRAPASADSPEASAAAEESDAQAAAPEPKPEDTGKPILDERPEPKPEPEPELHPGPFITGAHYRRQTIAAGYNHTAALHENGTVSAVGPYRTGECDVSDWTDMIAVAAGTDTTAGLRADGTVVVVGSNNFHQSEVSAWRDIVAISAGTLHTIGLCTDGTVVAVGDNSDGQCNVSDWENIAAIAAGSFHTVGLCSDGTVVAVGYNSFEQCNVSEWRDIVAIAAGGSYTVGLRSDGTVVAVGKNDSRQCSVTGWRDIVAIAAGGSHTVGLRSDGTAVAVGNNDDHQCDVTGWRDIVAIAAGEGHTIGLRSDGTAVAVGNNEDHQCSVSDWTDIMLPEDAPQ